jgi:MFS family permease
MSAWFSPQVAPLFSLSAMLALLALFGRVVQRGTHRRLVIGLYAAAMALGMAFLAATLAAFVLQQPSYVTRELLRCGILLTAIFGYLLFVVILPAYRRAEYRRISAKNL